MPGGSVRKQTGKRAGKSVGAFAVASGSDKGPDQCKLKLLWNYNNLLLSEAISSFNNKRDIPNPVRHEICATESR